MKLLQLTGLVLTVSTLYVWSRVPLTSFEPEYGEVISFWTEEESPLGLAGLSSHASLEEASRTFRGTVTWYGIWKRKGVPYDGQECASGVIFRQDKITFAAPVERRNGKPVYMKDGRYKPVVPFGTIIKVTVNGKTIQGPVTDTCIGGTWDTSTAGMKGLGFKNPQQKLPGATVEVL